MDERLTLNSDTETVVRMYGQGFGDCFLLAFPRRDAAGNTDPTKPVYVVIDSGVFFQTPQDRDRMRRVAQSIKESTGGDIDLLIATHEHHDHLCGFEYAREIWQKIGVRYVWVAWTEKKGHPATDRYDQEAEALKKMAEAARRAAAKKRAENPALADAIETAFSLIGFQGEDFAVDGNGIPVLNQISVTVDKVLDDIVNDPKQRFRADPDTFCEFCEPKQVRIVPDTAVDAYILGPPMEEAWLALDFPTDAQQRVEEIYHGQGQSDGAHLDSQLAFEADIALKAAQEREERKAFATALARYASAPGDPLPEDTGMPFSRRRGIPYDQARSLSFFQENYFADAKSALQIEEEWLRGAGQFALQMDRLTNNTSLVIAFRLPDERVLLFVGDAQVGNWLSWQTIRPEDWKRPNGGAVEYRPTIDELLSHVVVYKVGHHGSHNATVKKSGLEKMPDGLVAFVPSSRRYPQEFQKSGKPWSIPLPALTDRLNIKCNKQVIHPHQAPASVEKSSDSFAPMTRANAPTPIEGGVPVWQQVRI